MMICRNGGRAAFQFLVNIIKDNTLVRFKVCKLATYNNMTADGTKKDFSTAIMDRKKAPHKLQVEDSKQDDNSIVEMTQSKMDELKIFRGDAVILKGKQSSSQIF